MLRRVGDLLRAVAFLALASPGLSLAQPAPSAPQQLVLPVLVAARDVELDMSAGEVRETLRGRGFALEMETDLPPDGLNRLMVAVPGDDDCIPRAAPFICPSIRVVLLNDPQRGHRVVRVEAFQKVEIGASVADVFGIVAASMGPPLQTEMTPEQVRGGAVVVWRQRWRDGLSEGPLTEIFVTQEPPLRPGLGLADPREPATGVGYVVADTEAEGAFASVRRRLRPGASLR
jgi:hypothetical protein